jgi:hypothetical protein
MYWNGLEPSELLDYDSRLVAFTQERPFQEGKPLSPIVEEGDGSIELLEYSHTANNVDDDELGPEYDDEQLTDVSADEPMADTPQDENEEHRRIRRV